MRRLRGAGSSAEHVDADLKGGNPWLLRSCRFGFVSWPEYAQNETQLSMPWDPFPWNG